VLIHVLPLRALVPATSNDGGRLPRLRRALRQSEPNKVCCFIVYRTRGDNARRYQVKRNTVKARLTAARLE
jgi:hypothetical protein